MKKSTIFFLSLFFIAFLACNSSDDDIVLTDDDQSGGPQSPIELFPENFQATGSSANDILSNNNFSSITVEIAFVQGFRPTQEAIDGFEDFLQLHSFKENINLVFTELPSPQEADLTLQEISDLEIENRTVYNDGDNLGVYIYFADAPSENDDLDEGLVTLGAVYRNTSMVIYESTIIALASNSNVVTATDIEGATLNHEFGHLMGLVNLGTVAINDHEDTTTDDNGNVVGNNHCNVPGCLMLAQLSFNLPSIRQNISFGKEQGLKSECSLNGHQLLEQLEINAAASSNSDIVPVLDPECRLDLSGNGGRPSTDI